MASSFSDLGIELMATGENAGTWGTKTNTNLQIVEKAVAGYVEQAVTSGGTTALTITDGDATESTSVARHAVIKLTGTITGNSIVTVPDSIEKVYIVTNGTSGAILLSPVPDSTYEYQIHYNRIPDKLEASSNETSFISLNFPNGLLYCCLAETYGYLKGPADMLQLYEQKYQQEVQKFGGEQIGRRRRDDYTDGTIRIPVNSPTP